VNHWVVFRNSRRRDKFIEKIKPLEFKVDSLKVIKAPYYKYQVVISRKDSIDPESITQLTKELAKFSLLFSGIYDGWGLDPVREED
nr:ribonuclease E inhibitor RraB [Flavobacteriaceae bacterium]